MNLDIMVFIEKFPEVSQGFSLIQFVAFQFLKKEATREATRKEKGVSLVWLTP
jgi:hypothetical protein